MIQGILIIVLEIKLKTYQVVLKNAFQCLIQVLFISISVPCDIIPDLIKIIKRTNFTCLIVDTVKNKKGLLFAQMICRNDIQLELIMCLYTIGRKKCNIVLSYISQ